MLSRQLERFRLHRGDAEDGGQRSASRVRFRNSELDLYFQTFALGYVTYGGSSTGEAFYAAAHVDEKDLESWIGQWADAGRRAEQRAREASAAGHLVTARTAWLEAFTFHRTGNTCISVTDPRFGETYDTMRRCFQEAARSFDPPIEYFPVEFADGTLPGYFMRPSPDAGPRPTLVVIGGGDTYAEDLYFWGGAAGLERGWNVLGVDLPGQGATARDGLHHRADAETPFAAVLDALLARPDVDASRVAAYGVSLGGYLVLRAAVHDRRIRAVAASTPIMDWRALLFAAMPAAIRPVPQVLDAGMSTLKRFFPSTQRIAYEKFFEWQVGAASTYQALELFRDWTVDPTRLTCPLLSIVGSGEGRAFRDQARRAHDLVTAPKRLVEFPAHTGADAHAQGNNLRLAHATVFDWLEETMRPSDQRRGSRPPATVA